MKSRRFNWSKSIRTPLARAELQDIELAANSQRVSEGLYNLLAGGEGGRCPNRVRTRSFGDVGSMSGLPRKAAVERRSVDVSNVSQNRTHAPQQTTYAVRPVIQSPRQRGRAASVEFRGRVLARLSG